MLPLNDSSKVKPAKRKYALALSKNLNKHESLLWDILQYGIYGYKFQKQTVVFGYIPDFWCPKLRLAVDVNGSIHNRPDRIQYDRLRYYNLKRMGIRLLVFSNKQVESRMSYVKTMIKKLVLEREKLYFSNVFKGKKL